MGKAGATEAPCLRLPNLTAHDYDGLVTNSFRAAVALRGVNLVISTRNSLFSVAVLLSLVFQLFPSTCSSSCVHESRLRRSQKAVVEIPGLCLAGQLVRSHTEIDTFRQN